MDARNNYRWRTSTSLAREQFQDGTRPILSTESRFETLMNVSIIYVNWNSENYIEESIDSIYKHTDGLQFEIIVVDNASPLGNVDILKERFPQITLIKSSANLGFAGANNLGFRSSSGE